MYHIKRYINVCRGILLLIPMSKKYWLQMALNTWFLLVFSTFSQN